MDPKDIKILAVLAVAIVAVIVVFSVVGGSDDPSEPTPEPEVSPDMIMACDFTISDFISTSYGNSYATDGSEYVSVVYSAANVSDSQISLNTYNFKLQIDGVTYGHDLLTYSHKSYTGADSIGPDAKVSSALVFKVPEGSDVSSSTIVWDGFNKINLKVVPLEKHMKYNIGEITVTKTVGDRTASEGRWFVQIPYVITTDLVSNASINDVHLSAGMKIYDVVKELSDVDDMGVITSSNTVKGVWTFNISGDVVDKVYFNNADLDNTLIV